MGTGLGGVRQAGRPTAGRRAPSSGSIAEAILGPPARDFVKLPVRTGRKGIHEFFRARALGRDAGSGVTQPPQDARNRPRHHPTPRSPRFWVPADGAGTPEAHCLDVAQPTRQGPQFHTLVPSVLAFHDQQVYVGWSARQSSGQSHGPRQSVLPVQITWPRTIASAGQGTVG